MYVCQRTRTFWASCYRLPRVHKQYRKLMFSVECGSLFSTSFTQETRSWLWPMLPPWRLALARYKASAPKTPRTLSKWSERSVCCFSYKAPFIPILPSSLFLWWHAHLSPLSADSLLGFLCLRRNGRDRGVAAGRPTHLASDTWTQSQLQLEGNANARLKGYAVWLSIFWQSWTAEKIFIFNPHCYKSSPTTKKNQQKQHVWLPSKTSCKKKKYIHWSKCTQTHCSGMRKYILCGAKMRSGGSLSRLPQRSTS